MKPKFTLLLLFLFSLGASAQVKIYEIYGGGGNSEAPYNADYIILVNTGATNVDLTGWSIQYAAATGTNWDIISIPSGTIAANFGFFLIKTNAAGSSGVALPTPDLDISTVNLNAISGKIALMNNSTAFPINTSDPQGLTGFQDFIGYGGTASTAPNASEGSSPAPTASNTSALRKNQDTNVNGVDYRRVTPTPLNSSSPLPVTLTSFKGSTLGQEVNLNWTTVDAFNFSHFFVERSTDAVSFEAIGRVDATVSDATEKIDYQFIDFNAKFGVNYYRLRQVDIDKSFEYSRIISVSMTESSPIIIYPNPSAASIKIKNGELENLKSYRIYNATGAVIREVEHISNQEISIQDLPSGAYHLQFTNTNNEVINRRFIKQ